MSSTVQQAPGLWRTDLQRHDLSVPGREVIQNRVDIGPRTIPRLDTPGPFGKVDGFPGVLSPPGEPGASPKPGRTSSQARRRRRRGHHGAIGPLDSL